MECISPITEIQVATEDETGVVKPDGITISVDEFGTLSVIPQDIGIDIATTEAAGLVKPDGDTIDVDEDGTISVIFPDIDSEPTEESDNAVSSNAVYEALAEKLDISKVGAANGVASLDSNGRVPYSQLPTSAMEFKGMWNASTNSPLLSASSGTNGDFYIVSVGGMFQGVQYEANDRIIFSSASGSWIRLKANEYISDGELVAKTKANATAVQALTESQLRNIKISATDLTPGTSTLATGEIYIVYQQ